jgi:hypothetical protein
MQCFRICPEVVAVSRVARLIGLLKFIHNGFELHLNTSTILQYHGMPKFTNHMRLRTYTRAEETAKDTYKINIVDKTTLPVSGP